MVPRSSFLRAHHETPAASFAEVIWGLQPQLRPVGAVHITQGVGSTHQGCESWWAQIGASSCWVAQTSSFCFTSSRVSASEVVVMPSAIPANTGEETFNNVTNPETSGRELGEWSGAAWWFCTGWSVLSK